MAHRHLLFVMLLAFPACGGKEDTSSSNTTTTGGGSSVAGGTGGSSGTTSGGGTGVAGQSGAGGQGQGGADWSSCAPKDFCVLESVGACGPGCEPAALGFPGDQQLRVDAYNKSHPAVPCVAIVVRSASRRSQRPQLLRGV